MKHLQTQLAFLLVSAFTAAAQTREPTTGLLGAFGPEVALLEQKLADAQERRILGVRFVEGRLHGRRVVVALTGVGKVSAAMITTLLIHQFGPSEIIFTGIAGGLSPDVSPGDIVVATKTAQHDLGTLATTGMKNRGTRNPVDGTRNPVFFPGDERLLKLAKAAGSRIPLTVIATSLGDRRPRVVEGTVVTGDVFVASAEAKAAIRDRLNADAVEMEGAAVAQVCWQLGRPCLVVRSISDLADKNAGRDAKRFLNIAAHNSALLVSDIVKQLGAGGR